MKKFLFKIIVIVILFYIPIHFFRNYTFDIPDIPKTNIERDEKYLKVREKVYEVLFEKIKSKEYDNNILIVEYDTETINIDENTFIKPLFISHSSINEKIKTKNYKDLKYNKAVLKAMPDEKYYGYNSIRYYLDVNPHVVGFNVNINKIFRKYNDSAYGIHREENMYYIKKTDDSNLVLITIIKYDEYNYKNISKIRIPNRVYTFVVEYK